MLIEQEYIHLFVNGVHKCGKPLRKRSPFASHNANIHAETDAGYIFYAEDVETIPLDYNVDSLYPVIDLCGNVRDMELVFPPYEV